MGEVVRERFGVLSNGRENHPTRRRAVLVFILAGLVALAPSGWWALGVFVVVIPVVFASLIWAAGQPVTPTAVVVGSTAMAAGVAAYALVVLGLGRLPLERAKPSAGMTREYATSRASTTLVSMHSCTDLSCVAPWVFDGLPERM